MGTSQKTRLHLSPASANSKLDSWKAIAAYLDRDPRTVQLWERSEGLPVHRLNHHSRASVYAYTTEIDEWMRSRSDRNRRAMPRTVLPRGFGVTATMPLLKVGFYALTILLLAAMMVAALLLANRN